MKEKLDKALCEKYPIIFTNRNAPMTHTAMCWGFECGDGWYNIIDVLCGMLYSQYRQAKDRYENLVKWKKECGAYPWKGGETITDENIAEAKAKMNEEAERIPTASQIKEKFGGLRFYVDRASDKHYNYISFAENMSYRTCEECGDAGTYYPIGWHRTLCDKHADVEYGEEAAEYRNKKDTWSDEEEA
jgi:hypothetical protein